MIANAHQVNTVVIVVIALEANVQELVLENHVNMITIAEVVYPVVVLIKHVLSVVLETFVPLLGTAHLMNFVVN